MTKDEVRALDRWLAEEVMGLTPPVIEDLCRVEYAGEAKNQRGCGMLGTETWDIDCEDWRKEYYRDKQIPYYTTSISDAFEVVEKMENCLHLRQHGGKAGGWVANFCASTWEEVEADTAPLAICLAAKKAIEGR